MDPQMKMKLDIVFSFLFENSNPKLGLLFSFCFKYSENCGNSSAARPRPLRADLPEYSDNSDFFRQLSEYSENSKYPELSEYLEMYTNE